MAGTRKTRYTVTVWKANTGSGSYGVFIDREQAEKLCATVNRKLDQRGDGWRASVVPVHPERSAIRIIECLFGQ